MLRDHSNKWIQKYTTFWWKQLGTNHKLPHSSTLIVFLRENELFQRGWGVFVTLVEIPKGWGVISSLQKWKIQGGGGVLSEIPSVVGVWIFSGTTHYGNQMQWVPLIGIENVYFYVVETYFNKICYIFFYNFLVHLYCFKLGVVFFVISINDFTK